MINIHDDKCDEADLIKMNKINIYEENVHQQDYINELKSPIGFLKGEVAHKNIIPSLITKIIPPLSHIETMPITYDKNISKMLQTETNGSPELITKSMILVIK